MSTFYYIACEENIEGRPNPYVKMYSVNEAISAGIEVDLDFLDENLDRNAKNAIMFCEDEDKIDYLNIYPIKKKDFRFIVKSGKKYLYAVDFGMRDENINALLDFLKEKFELTDCIDLYRILLGENDESHKNEIKIDELTFDKLKDFLCSDFSENLLRITK